MSLADLLGNRTYGLAYLQAIHRQLFQDVYVWAGDVRTLGIQKGGESFCLPGSISQSMDHVAAEIYRLNQLKDVPEAGLARTVAYLYDYANFAHPFREGNGRSTREFFDLLLSERGARRVSILKMRVIFPPTDLGECGASQAVSSAICLNCVSFSLLATETAS